MDDTTLDAAKEEAVAEEVEGLEEVAEEVVEEEITPEEIEETIPTDHKERSNLGRKVSALLNKSDKMEKVIAQQAHIIERLMPEEEDDSDELVTRGELKKIVSQPQKAASQYEGDFIDTFNDLCEINGLSDEEREGVTNVLFEKYNKQIKGDGKIDGALNFEKAKADYFSGKKVPLKGKKASGVVTKQKTKPKGKAPAKLDEVSEKYLAMIERLDGPEKAERLRKSLA